MAVISRLKESLPHCWNIAIRKACSPEILSRDRNHPHTGFKIEDIQQAWLWWETYTLGHPPLQVLLLLRRLMSTFNQFPTPSCPNSSTPESLRPSHNPRSFHMSSRGCGAPVHPSLLAAMTRKSPMEITIPQRMLCKGS